MNMRKSVTLLAAAMMATSLGADSVPSIGFGRTVEPSWKRKKCKSCNLFPTDCTQTKRPKPMNNACKDWKSK